MGKQKKYNKKKGLIKGITPSQRFEIADYFSKGIFNGLKVLKPANMTRTLAIYKNPKCLTHSKWSLFIHWQGFTDVIFQSNLKKTFNTKPRREFFEFSKPAKQVKKRTDRAWALRLFWCIYLSMHKYNERELNEYWAVKNARKVSKKFSYFGRLNIRRQIR